MKIFLGACNKSYIETPKAVHVLPIGGQFQKEVFTLCGAQNDPNNLPEAQLCIIKHISLNFCSAPIIFIPILQQAHLRLALSYTLNLLNFQPQFWHSCTLRSQLL
jgi:hypothetical protein